MERPNWTKYYSPAMPYYKELEKYSDALDKYIDELEKRNHDLTYKCVLLDEAVNKACDRLFQITSKTNFHNVDSDCFEQRDFNAVEWKEWCMKND